MRVSYWTTASLEPEFEAVSKEIVDLATHFTRSRVFSVSPHLRVKLTRRPFTVGVHPIANAALRLLIPLLERRGDINHIYAEVSPWLYFRTLRRKPIVLTIASEKGDLLSDFIQRCGRIVVQTEGMQKRLVDKGVDAGKVRLIYPGVNLSRFLKRPANVPARQPRILLATFPRTEEELESRGVKFLLEVARHAPRLQFSLLSRPWRSGGTALGTVKMLIEQQELKNVRVLEGVQESMASLYAQHDFTVIPYTRTDGGKECPLSLVETLACGVPVLISSVAPFASFVGRHECGRVFGSSVEQFVAAVEEGMRTYARLSEHAVACAHEHFDRERTFKQYAAVYSEVHA